MIIQCIASSIGIINFIPINKITSYVNTTRGVNGDTLMTLDCEYDITYDMQSSMTTRTVERGSYFVSTPSTTQITLQTSPKGNIEIICPLALTLPCCIKNLT